MEVNYISFQLHSIVPLKSSFKQVIKFKKDFLGEQLNEVEMISNLPPYSVI